MLIKAADGREPQIAALEALLRRPDVAADTRRRIESEIKGVRVNRMTIHDLRIEVDGRVAQIDHLVISRLLDVWVLESMHFSEGVPSLLVA
jgi:hypothetical protein